jgi:hypothetical protein
MGAARPLGFRNLTNYIARSLLETGGFRPRLPSIMKNRISGQAGAEETNGSQHQPRSRLNNRKKPVDATTEVLGKVIKNQVR